MTNCHTCGEPLLCPDCTTEEELADLGEQALLEDLGTRRAVSWRLTMVYRPDGTWDLADTITGDCVTLDDAAVDALVQAFTLDRIKTRIEVQGVMDLHQAAVVAAMDTRARFPDYDHPVVVSFHLTRHVLTATLDDVDHALALVDGMVKAIPAQGITLIAEAVYAPADDEDDVARQAGTLQRRAEQGDTDVRAIILVATATLTGTHHTAIPYRVVDGTVQWDDPDNGQTEGGRIPDRLQVALLEAALVPPEPIPAREELTLTVLARLLTDVGVPADVTPLNPTP